MLANQAFDQVTLYTGRLWYCMLSCQPTVGLIILSMSKTFFHCTKSIFYSWLTTAHTVLMYKEFPISMTGLLNDVETEQTQSLVNSCF